MKKLILILSCVLLLVPAYSQGKSIVLRFSGASPLTHQLSQTEKFFADEVNKRGNGRITIQPFYNAELYKQSTVIDAISMGAVDMTFTAWSHWAGRNPACKIMDYAGMCISSQEFSKVSDKIKPIINRILEKQNCKVIFTTAFGYDGIISSVPITSPEDARGLRIRAPAPPHIASIAALGAVPTRIGLGELYDALAKKAIDGAFSNVSSMVQRKFIDVAKYVLYPTTYGEWLNLMNLKTWNSLPPDIQQIIIDAGKKATAFSYELTPKIEKASIAKLASLGTVTTLNRKNIGPWMKKWQPVYENYVAECTKKGFGDDAKQLYEIFKAIQH